MKKVIKNWPVVLTLVVGLGIILAIFLYFVSLYEQERKTQFDEHIDQFILHYSDRFQQGLSELNSIIALYDASDYVSESEFQIFTKVVLKANPEIIFLGWAPREKVKDGYRYNLVYGASRADASNMQGARLDNNYVAPALLNKIALSGMIGMSPPISYDPANHEKYAEMGIAPIYKTKSIPDSATIREQALQGFAIAVFNVPNVIAQAASNLGLEVNIVDITQPGNPVLIFSQITDKAMSVFEERRVITLYGRQLEFTFVSPSAYYHVEGIWLGLIVLGLALIFLFVLCGYIWSAINRTRVIQDLVERRTQELRSTNASLLEQMTDNEQQRERLEKYAAELKLIQSIISIFDEVLEPEKAIRACLNLISQALGWPIGHVYVINDDANQLLPTDIWQMDEQEKHQAFYDATMKTVFKSGIGLPGRVWQADEPAWIEDISIDPNFPRNKICSELNLKTAFAFAVYSADELAYVLEFFRYERQPKDDDTLKLAKLISDNLSELLTKQVVEKQLRSSEERNRLLLESAGEGIYGIDLRGRTTFINPAAEKMLGFTADELSGKYMHPLVHHSYPDGTHYPPDACFIHHVRQTGQEAAISNEVFWRKDGSSFPVEYIARPIYKNGKLNGVVVTFSDITEQLKAKEEHARIARTDKLTGLPNRHAFEEELSAVIDRVSRLGSSFTLIYADFDDFKDINDTLGHDVGDALLVEAANRLTKWSNKGDVLVRIGGDEFACICVSCGGRAGAEVRSKELVDLLSEPYQLNGVVVNARCTVGGARYPDEAKDTISLIKYADVALFDAKTTGKGSYSIFDHSMNERYLRRIQVVQDLKVALARGEIYAVFQPQFDMRTGKCTGAESLMRWQHPTLGTIPPSEFIPIAEDTGVIQELGAWMVDTCARQYRQWLDAGHGLRQLSINVSPLQLLDEHFIENFFKVLQIYQVPEHAIEIELTESDIMGFSKTIQAALTALSARGVKIAIDDFGTGFSSLGRLKDLPVTCLKIDASFVSDAMQDKSTETIIIAIISLAKSLGLAIVAEGVETQEQVDFLLSHGCVIAQGFFYSKPISAADMIKFL